MPALISGNLELQFASVNLSSSMVILGICAALAGMLLALLSRHKKSATGDLHLIGATAVVETNLDPEGTVFVRGELWAARSNDDTSIARKYKVQIVGARGPLLLVKATDRS